MPVPAFTIDGVIPPYTGADGPGGTTEQMTPYEATPLEVVARFAGSDGRREILRHWLEHRQLLRDLGIQVGFQWLDGSFVEDKEPNDLDLVTFFRRPAGAQTSLQMHGLMRANPATLMRRPIREARKLDAFFVDLDGSSEGIIDATRYWCGLFSHRRVDGLWKGMVKVSLAPEDEDLALISLREPDADEEHEDADIQEQGASQ